MTSKRETRGGYCPFCGQMQMVEAATDEEANSKAAENCNCDGSKKARSARQCADNIEEICGAGANNFNMEVCDAEVIEALKALGNLVVFDDIESAVIRLADSTVAIKQTKDGVSVARKKALSVKLEA